MKTLLLLIVAFGLIVSLAFNAYLINDIEIVWVELMEIHKLLIEVLERLQTKSVINII